MSIHLQTVGMVVKNMATSIAFYRALGLPIPAGEEFSPHVEFESSNGCVLGFDTEDVVAQSDPHCRAPQAGQRISLQFECSSPAEVDAVHARLLAQGGTEYAAPWDAFWGQRFARVADPDGNVVGLFADLAGQ